jgi:hypothetical protein
VKLFRRAGIRETIPACDEAVSVTGEDALKPMPDSEGPVQPARAWSMWWVFIISLALVYPIVEGIEERLQRWADSKRLVDMRRHVELRHRWDTKRGQWVN